MLNKFKHLHHTCRSSLVFSSFRLRSVSVVCVRASCARSERSAPASVALRFSASSSCSWRSSTVTCSWASDNSHLKGRAPRRYRNILYNFVFWGVVSGRIDHFIENTFSLFMTSVDGMAIQMSTFFISIFF